MRRPSLTVADIGHTGRHLYLPGAGFRRRAAEKSETARCGNPKVAARQPCCPVSFGQSETNPESTAPMTKSAAGFVWLGVRNVGPSGLLRIAGTTPGKGPQQASASGGGVEMRSSEFRRPGGLGRIKRAARVLAAQEGSFGSCAYSVWRRRSQPTRLVPRPTRIIAPGAGTGATDTSTS